MNRATVIIVSLFAMTAVTLAFAGTEEPDPAGLTYIALGDSVASGNARPDPKVGPCQRDVESYPVYVRNVLDDEFTVSFHHLACSGARVVDSEDAIQRCHAEMSATTRELQNRRDDCELKSLEHQVSLALERIDDKPILVTITIGANDMSWTDPLTIIGLLLSPDDNFRVGIEEITADVERELTSQLKRLLAHDNVTIVLTDYYNPLNAESDLYNLILGAQAVAWGADNIGDRPCTGTDRDGNRHELSCADRFTYATESLNAVLTSMAASDPDRVLLAPVSEQFRGHEAPEGECGRAAPALGESWIRGTVDSGILQRPDCFHPNTLGARAIAAEVVSTWERVAP